MPRYRVIAHYLPQFHPIPENDEWWGKGFTEWDNVKCAYPVYAGQVQPRKPTDLGYYDLRDPLVRERQAEIAARYRLSGFMYWHYWMGGGKRLLDRPFQDVLRSKSPDFPFCLGWANHSWKGVWKGGDPSKGIEQLYPGMDDHRAHFEYLRAAFEDDRYILIDGKPLFFVFAPKAIPEVIAVTDFWRELAAMAGFKGLHLVCYTGFEGNGPWDPKECGFDAHTFWPLDTILRRKSAALDHFQIKNLGEGDGLNAPGPTVLDHERLVREWLANLGSEYLEYPTVLPNWDTTPRYAEKATILHGSSPDLFRESLDIAARQLRGRSDEHSIVFLKSWNEWGEGNYIEPDEQFGHRYLEVLREWVDNTGKVQSSSVLAKAKEYFLGFGRTK